jgi:hypothetical protein
MGCEKNESFGCHTYSPKSRNWKEKKIEKFSFESNFLINNTSQIHWKFTIRHHVNDRQTKYLSVMNLFSAFLWTLIWLAPHEYWWWCIYFSSTRGAQPPKYTQFVNVDRQKTHSKTKKLLHKQIFSRCQPNFYFVVISQQHHPSHSLNGWNENVRIENYVSTQKKNKREKNLPLLLPLGVWGGREEGIFSGNG